LFLRFIFIGANQRALPQHDTLQPDSTYVNSEPPAKEAVFKLRFGDLYFDLNWFRIHYSN